MKTFSTAAVPERVRARSNRFRTPIHQFGSLRRWGARWPPGAGALGGFQLRLKRARRGSLGPSNSLAKIDHNTTPAPEFPGVAPAGRRTTPLRALNQLGGPGARRGSASSGARDVVIDETACSTPTPAWPDGLNRADPGEREHANSSPVPGRPGELAVVDWRRARAGAERVSPGTTVAGGPTANRAVARGAARMGGWCGSAGQIACRCPVSRIKQALKILHTAAFARNRP